MSVTPISFFRKIQWMSHLLIRWKTLIQIFGEQSSLFNTQYQCLKLPKRDSDKFIRYAGIINRECSRFQLSSLTEDQFNCRIFICGLQSPKNADIRTHLLTEVQQDAKTTHQMLAEECQNVLNPKHDADIIQLADNQRLNINTILTTKLHFTKGQARPTAKQNTPFLLQAMWCLSFPPRLPLPPELLPCMQENWAQRLILSKHSE